MRVASIDIGTNSVLMLIADVRGGHAEKVAEHATITRLGQDVDATGELADAAVARTVACLERYAQLIEDNQVQRVAAVATSAMRDARGGEGFLGQAQTILGTRPEVISGLREAQLTFEGALSGMQLDGPVAVFDIGGGSTEIIVGEIMREQGIVTHEAVSLNIGSVRLTERHLHDDPPTAAQLEAVRETTREALKGAPALRGTPLVGVAGTVTALAAISHRVVPYNGAAIHGCRVSLTQLAKTTNTLSALVVEQRRDVPALDPRRADVIVAGAVIVQTLMEAAQAPEFWASDRGVRWGLATTLASEPPPATER